MDQHAVAVECSPNTFRRIQTDNSYRNEVLGQILESQSDDFVPINSDNEQDDFVPINSDNEQDMPDFESNIQLYTEEAEEKSETKCSMWLEAPTKMLLSLLEEFQPQLGKTFGLKNKTRMWQKIQQKLAAEGYNFSTAQVQGKFRSLERKFKDTQLNNSKTGRNRRTCPYENELKALLSEKRGIYPEYTLSSDTTRGTRRESVLNATAPDENTPSTSEDSCKPAKKRNSGSFQQQLLNTMDQIRKDKAEYQAKVLQRIDNRDAVEREKVEILKKILDRISND